MMALEHLRLLAASLAVAFVATSCSLSTGDSNDSTWSQVAELDRDETDVKPVSVTEIDSGEAAGSSIASATPQDPQGQEPKGEIP